ncbi:uncharacterized protein PAF06_003554 [Gastrophryne carolinensis]
MQKYFLHVVVLQFAFIFSLLHGTQGDECAKCPAGYKWSECVDCNSFCPYDNCQLQCTPGCVCEQDNEVLNFVACVPKGQCGDMPIDPISCPYGSRQVRECRRCENYCPKHLTEEECDCATCVWGCKCWDENLIIDTTLDECVPADECTSEEDKPKDKR